MLIQNIGDNEFDVAFNTDDPQELDYIMPLDQQDVLLNPETNKLYQIKDFLEHESFRYIVKKENLVHAFTVNGRKIFLPLQIPKEMPNADSKEYVRNFGKEKPEIQLAGATAIHLNIWYQNHRYCGCCGGKNSPDKNERALKCEKCGHLTFPVICPAIIVAVVDKERDKILLTRSTRRKNSIFSLISGYTEIGETLEQTCVREAFEECGVHAKNPKYYVNQPWGFSGSLMVGFFAELDGSPELTLQEEEIAEARWFSKDEVPVSDSPIDITHYMMEMWRTGKVEI